MGTLLSLGIGNMELDWGKYNVYTDFSMLFQAEDYVEIPYIYQDEEGKNKIVMKEGFSKKLSEVIKIVPIVFLMKAYHGLHDLEIDVAIKKVGGYKDII